MNETVLKQDFALLISLVLCLVLNQKMIGQGKIFRSLLADLQGFDSLTKKGAYFL